MALNKGIYFSILTAFLWALDVIFVKFVANTWDIQPILFASFTSFSAAIALLLFAGAGRLGVDTLKQVHTWAYSCLLILYNISFIYLLSVVSAAEASFMIRIVTVVSLILSWLFISRPPSKGDILGSIGIIAAVIIIFKGVDIDLRSSALLFLLITSLLFAIRVIITETHPSSIKAKNSKDYSRVTGYVLLVTSTIFLISCLFSSFLKYFSVDDALINSLLFNMPSFSDFTHIPTVGFAILLGIFNVSFSTYFCFRSTQIVKSETFLMVVSLTPVMVLVIEYSLGMFGIMDVSSINNYTLIGGGIAFGFSMLMVIMRSRKYKNKEFTIQ